MVRYLQAQGYMMLPTSLSKRVERWHQKNLQVASVQTTARAALERLVRDWKQQFESYWPRKWTQHSEHHHLHNQEWSLHNIHCGHRRDWSWKPLQNLMK
mmetsp:Transcript_22089/g.29842  ORF Transcript_22089/g.29842 Transcript_22089/m.29842 type:complete len:99 (+) Transcript_22089:193-489(+)